MATGEAAAGPIHPVPTQRSGYRYFFYEKHHGRGGPDAAQWEPSLSHEEEFGVFDLADLHEVSDEGRLYGIGRDSEGRIRSLGIWDEQVAEFPAARDGELWHGYPLWPLLEKGPVNRRGQKHRPAKAVFRRMEEERLLTTRERKRLEKGDYA
jgi:hypothetical protein